MRQPSQMLLHPPPQSLLKIRGTRRRLQEILPRLKPVADVFCVPNTTETSQVRKFPENTLITDSPLHNSLYRITRFPYTFPYSTEQNNCPPFIDLHR